MRDAVAESRPVEKRRGEDVEGVEPAAGLPDVLDDEVARVVVVEPVPVFERIMHLGERHRAGFEPAVEDVAHPAHGRLPARIVGIGPGQGVDERTVQIGDLHAEILLQLGEGAVDVHSGEVRVVADPHGNRGAPVAIARDRPIARSGQPVAEDSVFDVLGRPRDLLVELDHAVPYGRHLDEPGRHGLVDKRLAAAPAMGVAVDIALALDEHGLPVALNRSQRPARIPQISDDRLVCVEDLQALVIGDFGGEAASVVDRNDRADSGLLAGDHVVLAECRRHVDQTGAVVTKSASTTVQTFGPGSAPSSRYSGALK